MKFKTYKKAFLAILLLALASCKTGKESVRIEDSSMPEAFVNGRDSLNAAAIDWRNYFNDSHLVALIDTALKNNQELNIVMQEIAINNSEVLARKGRIFPSVGIGAGAGLDKVGKYTRNGAVEDQLEVAPNRAFPEPLNDYDFGAYADWEVDVWKKLRNSKRAAVARYLGSIEGKNFMVTNLIAEIANSYYELMALDNLIAIVEQNIEIQSNALRVVKQQKNAARVSQLAVNRFEAQLLNTKNLQYSIQQDRVQTENRIHFLTGRFPQPIERNWTLFNDLTIDSIAEGIPSQLLSNRPDIRQAELELMAAKLDVKAARAEFYPSLRISAGLGYQAFNPNFLLRPQSLIYSLSGELMAPLINRSAIRAEFNSATAQQIQAVYHYEQTILNAYVDVLNQLAKLDNYSKGYDTKEKEVQILKESIGVANSLFLSARADYAEVLLTQREALEAKIELIEIKKEQLNAKVGIYRALGGGWK